MEHVMETEFVFVRVSTEPNKALQLHAIHTSTHLLTECTFMFL